MATAVESLTDMPPGIRRWAETLDSEYNLGTPAAQAVSELAQAYAHVQRSSPLGRWMYEISLQVDLSTTEVVLFWNLLEACRLTEGQIPASSPFGVWMREMSYRNLVVPP